MTAAGSGLDLRWEPERLDDQGHLVQGDPAGMLPAVASAAAQVRTAYRAGLEAGVPRIRDEGRPRAIVVAGVGASGIAGDVLAAVCGFGAAVPIVCARSFRLPGWVGAADLVIAVSCSGSTAETVAMATEAVRRGCRLLVVSAPGTPLHHIARQGSAPHIPVQAPAGGSRAAVWGLSIPLVAAAAALDLTQVDEEAIEGTARLLEDVAHRCRPSSESFINPGKTLALALAETLPVVWGSSPLAAVAARRLAAQLNVTAKYPAVWGELPQAAHEQLSAAEGPFATRDIFADDPGRTLRLVVLRDPDEHPEVAREREISMRIAQDRDVRVTEIVAEGSSPLERLAMLVQLADYASVYLALGYGADPTPTPALAELRARVSR
jgi:glucose/mannose-6-phosphate isomerase